MPSVFQRSIGLPKRAILQEMVDHTTRPYSWAKRKTMKLDKIFTSRATVFGMVVVAAQVFAQPVPAVTTITDLGTLGGTGAGASDINDLEQVVGISTTASGEDHATL